MASDCSDLCEVVSRLQFWQGNGVHTIRNFATLNNSLEEETSGSVSMSKSLLMGGGGGDFSDGS